MFKTPLLIGLLVSTIAILGCGEDDPVKGPPTLCPFGDCDPYKELVLARLEASYNQKNITMFEELLDRDFVFFFAPVDVGAGAPAQWGRADELYLTTRLFDPGLPQPGEWRFDVDIQFESGVQWVEMIPDAFPDEVWYMVTVFYEFSAQFESQEVWVTAPGAQAQFTVRNTGTAAGPVWKLVEWRDLGVTSPPARTFEIYKTWGGFKASFIPALSPP